MKHFRRIWDEEKTAFVKSTKGMTRQEALQAFRARYPELKDEVTDMAFFDHRTRCKAANPYTGRKYSRAIKPLYSEHVKAGYVQIKIAQPNVWISKAQWVYMCAHPDEDLSERSAYVFLDGDLRNFAPENIERIKLTYMSFFNNLGGVVKGRADLTRINIARAKLKKAQLDALDKCGALVQNGSGRKDREERNRYAREYARKNKEHVAELRKKRYWKNRDEILRRQRERRAREKLRRK